jgi:hypothetical protein
MGLFSTYSHFILKKESFSCALCKTWNPSEGSDILPSVCMFYFLTIQRVSVVFGIMDQHLFHFILPWLCVYYYP